MPEVCLIDSSRRKRLVTDLKQRPVVGELVVVIDRCFKVQMVVHNHDAHYNPYVVVSEVQRDSFHPDEWLQYEFCYDEVDFLKP